MTLNRSEWVFCAKYKDLCDLAASRDEYDLIKTSALLRHLINEGLYRQANERTKLDIQFQIVEIAQELQNEISSIIGDKIILQNDVMFLSPEMLDHANSKKISPSDFLKLIAQKVNGGTNEKPQIKSITVKETISYGANILGGVHTGKPQYAAREKQEALERFSAFRVLGLPWSLNQLIPIAQIVRRGFKPLYDRLQTDTKV